MLEPGGGVHKTETGGGCTAMLGGLNRKGCGDMIVEPVVCLDVQRYVVILSCGYTSI
jgi:hypothetical protein